MNAPRPYCFLQFDAVLRSARRELGPTHTFEHGFELFVPAGTAWRVQTLEERFQIVWMVPKSRWNRSWPAPGVIARQVLSLEAGHVEYIRQTRLLTMLMVATEPNERPFHKVRPWVYFGSPLQKELEEYGLEFSDGRINDVFPRIGLTDAHVARANKYLDQLEEPTE